MNRYLKTSVASLFAISTLAGGAFAQAAGADKAITSEDKGPSLQEQQEMLDENTTGSVSGDMMNSTDVGGWQSGDTKVVVISTLNDDDPERVALSERMESNPDEVAALQSSIQSNPALMAQLESQNVQINNIVAAKKAIDGSVTFYVQ